jgi:amidase
MMPSNRASLYSLKPTHGFSSTKGIVPVSLRLDTIGPMAKSPEEVGIVLDILAGNTTKYSTAAENKSWSDIRIGTLDPEVWKQPPGMIKPDAGASTQMLVEVKAAYAKLKPLVKHFHENVDFIPVTELAVDGTTRLMKVCCEQYTSKLFQPC